MKDQRTASAYIFGAICPALGKAVGLVLPLCNTEAMELHLEEIALAVQPGAHAVLFVDQAGWHVTGKLVSIPVNSRYYYRDASPDSDCFNSEKCRTCGIFEVAQT